MPNEFQGTWRIRSIRNLLGTTAFVQAFDSTVVDYAGITQFDFPLSIDHNGTIMTSKLSATENGSSFTASKTVGDTPNQRTYTATVQKYSLTRGNDTETFLLGIIGRTSNSKHDPLTDADTVSFTAVKTG